MAAKEIEWETKFSIIIRQWRGIRQCSRQEISKNEDKEDVRNFRVNEKPKPSLKEEARST
jgi:hypothetical protein